MGYELCSWSGCCQKGWGGKEGLGLPKCCVGEARG